MLNKYFTKKNFEIYFLKRKKLQLFKIKSTQKGKLSNGVIKLCIIIQVKCKKFLKINIFYYDIYIKH